MDDMILQLSRALTESYELIEKYEEGMIKKSHSLNISVSEIHLLQAIASENNTDGKSISQIAEALDITLASVTVAVNKLVEKGYVEKVKNPNDGRSVYVTLTKRGSKVNNIHTHFHMKMAKNVLEKLSTEEQLAIIKGMTTLNSLFKSEISKKM